MKAVKDNDVLAEDVEVRHIAYESKRGNGSP